MEVGVSRGRDVDGANLWVIVLRCVTHVYPGETPRFAPKMRLIRVDFAFERSMDRRVLELSLILRSGKGIGDSARLTDRATAPVRVPTQFGRTTTH